MTGENPGGILEGISGGNPDIIIFGNLRRFPIGTGWQTRIKKNKKEFLQDCSKFQKNSFRILHKNSLKHSRKNPWHNFFRNSPKMPKAILEKVSVKKCRELEKFSQEIPTCELCRATHGFYLRKYLDPLEESAEKIQKLAKFLKEYEENLLRKSSEKCKKYQKRLGKILKKFLQ